VSVKGGHVLFANAAAGNGSDVVVRGGKYALVAAATGWGTVKLQIKLKEGSYADVSSSTLSANGMLTLDLPAGTYRGVGATATAIYADLVHIPLM
jgi:hypothetical protein